MLLSVCGGNHARRQREVRCKFDAGYPRDNLLFQTPHRALLYQNEALASGETLDRVLAAAPGATLFYADPYRQRIRLPSQDVSAYAVDAFLLFACATAMEDRCPPR
jgi:hypothetical protein